MLCAVCFEMGKETPAVTILLGTATCEPHFDYVLQFSNPKVGARFKEIVEIARRNA